MEFLKKLFAVFAVIILFLLICFIFFVGCTPTGKTIWNEYIYSMEKTEEIDYQKRKSVEDTCRAMISSYNSDKLIYEQYKNSTVQEEISWSNNAKIRANQTASTYNNYILKNTYVWQDNVPNDIYMNLPYLQ